jgi:hypothetical protein
VVRSISCLRLTLPALLVATGFAARSTSAESLPAPVTCERACLYGVLDNYLAALKTHDPSRVRWAARPKVTENNVELRVGDGLWGTISGLGAYEMRLADPRSRQVVIFGVVEETTTKSPYALRLLVEDGAVTETELLVIRPQDAGIPFVNADMTSRAEFNELLPAAQRTPREQMITAANGYFDTLQLNDGTLHVEFTDDCNRREDGTQTTNNVQAILDPISKFGCADQFRLGQYRYDDRLRDRRFIAVDEERGIVVAAGFIDHEGRVGDFKLKDGSIKTSMFRRPHSFVLLEAFKIKGGKIQGVEAVFHTVPYNMPSPWDK